ncbi:polysaccharide deacetylase family protein [Microvirga calopogonii]|uniref:polysaccharide deacetylase family protein n=1 Tax=Microvirga calopogonii TaxID=2078013 RepID=UPI000E0CF2AA|nr:polysaccharide deacetylase family protein [Microvirga calopogonii]
MNMMTGGIVRLMAVQGQMNIRTSHNGVVGYQKRSKRQRLASAMVATGAVRMLEKFPQRNCLVVLNYHRIGSIGNTAGDPNLYSATPRDFEEQVRWIKKNYHISSMDEAIAFVEGKETFRRTGILLTFDDGYKDNYDYAFPILQRHKVQGTFFICTSYIGGSQLPWWDQIAYMLKTSQKSEMVLNYPERLSFDLSASWMQVLDRLLAIYKSGHDLDKDRFLREIGLATGTGDLRPNERIFIDKDELKEMSEGGMAIGSHTHSHPLLSHLSQEEQLEEVVSSKRLLEEHLGIDIQSLAYPVGSPDSFDGRTQAALREAGYRVAFSFYGGSNVAGRTERFDIRRHHVGIGDGEALFRVRTSTAAVMGKPLF